LLRGILANDEHPITAHDLAATPVDQALSQHVRHALDQRAAAIRLRADEYERCRAAVALDNAARAARSRDIGTERSVGDGLEL
jgi:hypothetical protein